MQREFQAAQENQLEQPDLELQLKVWKELAISKQVLMQTATKALGLADECSSDELEKALTLTIAQAKKAEIKFAKAQNEAKASIGSLQDKLEASEKANKAVAKARDEAIASIDAAEHKVTAGKQANSDELKKIKAQLADKQKEIKSITKVLADTPENVVKKMKDKK